MRCVFRELFQSRRGPLGEEHCGRWGIHPLHLEAVGGELGYAVGVGDWVMGGDVERKIGSGVTAGGLGTVDVVQSMGWEEARALSDYKGSVVSD